MSEDVLLRMIDETCRVLAKMQFPQTCDYLGPTYNTLVEAARANHPDEPFLMTLPIADPDRRGIAPEEMQILFSQLRIVLESLQPEQERDEWRPDETARAPRGTSPIASLLGEVDLSGVRLSGTKLDGADLRGANLHDADLRDADLTDAVLNGADLSDVRLNGANLRGANLRGANLHGARLQGADLSGLDLSGVNLADVNMSNVDLTTLLRTLRRERRAPAAPPAPTGTNLPIARLTVSPEATEAQEEARWEREDEPR